MQSFTIIRREPSPYISTSFNEIVTCRLADGSERRLLLKRGRASWDSWGHRGGVPYEAQVYLSVLQPLSIPLPRLFSVGERSTSGETALLIDYVDNAERLEFAHPEAILAAARWIGEFHRLNESRADALVPGICRYDEAYYLGWSERALSFSRHVYGHWLTDVCAHFGVLVRELLTGQLTVVHGEYYPKNILVRDKVIIPVDWESAAIAAGEIDLASLTEGWPDEYKRACAIEYSLARWPGGTPPAFERRLAIANMYLLFRWLGDRIEWTVGDDAELQFAQLRRLGNELGAFA